MRWFKYGLLITAVAVLLATAVRAGNSVDFAQSGVIVDIHTFLSLSPQSSRQWRR